MIDRASSEAVIWALNESESSLPGIEVIPPMRLWKLPRNPIQVVCLLSLPAVLALLLPLCAHRVKNELSFFIVLTIAQFLFQWFGLSRRRLVSSPVTHFAIVSFVVAILLKGGVLRADAASDSSAYIWLFLTLYLLLIAFATYHQWSGRRFWTSTICIALTAFFIDGFFNLTYATLLLPVLVAPGINYRLLAARWHHFPPTARFALVSFLTLGLLSAILNQSLFVALVRALSFFVPALFLLGSRLKTIREGTGIGLFANALIFLALFIQAPSGFFDTIFIEYNTNRVAGYLAAASVTVAGMALFHDWRGNLAARFFLGTAALMGIGLIFPLGSEGALGAMTLGITSMFLLRLMPTKFNALRFLVLSSALLVSISLLSITCYLLPEVLESKHSGLTKWLVAKGHVRFQLWSIFAYDLTSLNTIQLLFGQGPFSMDILASRDIADSLLHQDVKKLVWRTSGLYVHSHNILLEIAYGFGLLGLLAFLWFTIVLLHRASLSRMYYPASACLVVLLHGVVDFLLDVPSITFFLWLGLLFPLLHLNRSAETGSKFRNPSPKGYTGKRAIAAILLLSVVVLLSQHLAIEQDHRGRSLELLRMGVKFEDCIGTTYLNDIPDRPNRDANAATNLRPRITSALKDPTLLRVAGSIGLIEQERGIGRQRESPAQHFLDCVHFSNTDTGCRYGFRRANYVMNGTTGTEPSPSRAPDPFGLFKRCELKEIPTDEQL